MHSTLTTIHHLDALAGSGKTYGLAIYADKGARRGGEFLIAQPSKRLIEATLTDEFNSCHRYPLRAIHSGNCDSTMASIVEHSKAAKPGGDVLMITHKALLTLPYFEGKDRRTLIIDEIPQVDHFAEFNLPETGSNLFPLLTAECRDGGSYALVKPADEAARIQLDRMAENKRRDDGWNVFQEFCQRVISPHWDTYVLDQQFQEMRSGDKDRQRLQVFSLLKPSVFDGFGRVIMAGACFEESLLYRLWKHRGVEFRPMTGIDLRYDVHEGGDQITINYVSDEPWSKRFRNRAVDEDEDGDGGTVLDHVRRRVKAAVGDQPFLWMGNNDLADDFFHSPYATRLPNSPQGLNQFQAFHTTVVLSALNPRSCQFAFLQDQGIDGTAVRTNHYWSAAYQAVMRCAERASCRGL